MMKSGFQKLDTEIFIRVRNKALKCKNCKNSFLLILEKHKK